MAEIVAYSPSGQRNWLSLLTAVTDLSWTTGWDNGAPAGLQAVEWKMDLPPTAAPGFLQQGTIIELFDGPTTLGKAQITESNRDGGHWEVFTHGLGSALGKLLAIDGSNNPTSVPNTAVDNAIARAGLPITRPASLSGSAYSGNNVDISTVGGLLDAWAASVGKTWGVNAAGQITAAADPTAPSLLILPGQGVMGVADDNYFSTIYARYVTAVAGTPPAPSAWATTTVHSSAAATRWSMRKEGMLDLTGLGVLSGPQAATIAQARMDRAGARMGWTNALTPDQGSLVTVGTVPKRLAQVRAGAMAGICGVLDALGRLNIGAMQNVVIGETKYTDGDSSIYLAPVGLADRDFQSVLAAPDAPDLVATA